MSRRQVIMRTSAVLSVVVVIVATGYVLRSGMPNAGADAVVALRSALSGPSSTEVIAPSPSDASALKAAGAPGASASAASGASGSSGGAGAASPQKQGTSTRQVIVVTSSMDIRVKDVRKTVDAIRAAATAAGGSVSDLSVTSGPGATPSPQPLSDSGASRSTMPSSASATLRIPVAALPALETRLSALGEVVSQSSKASDMTQQHVDMTARLKNLKAEEARLRSLMNRAGDVSDLLEVESELSRVRGDIESMQAQLAYLENQAATATLSITLEQPGSLVRPPAATWGVADAVTSGVQAAVGLVGAFITGAIALAPIILVALLGWGVWRLARRMRGDSPSRPSEESTSAQTPSDA